MVSFKVIIAPKLRAKTTHQGPLQDQAAGFVASFSATQYIERETNNGHLSIGASAAVCPSR